MFALPAVPQDFTIQPRDERGAEVISTVPAEVVRAVEARTTEEYDAAMEELLELEKIPRLHIDLNALFAAFGSDSYTFVQSLAEFTLMRRLVPYGGAGDLSVAIRLVREEIYSNASSLEYSRRLLEFMESTVGLCALVLALNARKPVTSFFTRTLAERSLSSTRELRLLLEEIQRGAVSKASLPMTAAKLRSWATKGKDGVFRPFGEHVE